MNGYKEHFQHLTAYVIATSDNKIAAVRGPVLVAYFLHLVSRSSTTANVR